MRDPDPPRAPDAIYAAGGAVEAERSSVSVSEAREIVLGALHPLPNATVGLQEALGRVLAEEIRAPSAIPPRDNSGMDGYAVRVEDLATLPATLRVVEEVAAGATSRRRLGPHAPLLPALADRTRRLVVGTNIRGCISMNRIREGGRSYSG